MNNNILYINNLSRKISRHSLIINQSISRVLSSGFLVMGPELEKFQSVFSKYIGVDYCYGVANGTDALEIALRSLGMQANEIVATAANAGMYGTTALSAIGAKPYFMDVDLISKCITLDEVKKAITYGAKTIIATHLYGQAVPEINAIANFCKTNKVFLVEDCAQAHGAKINKKQVGSYGDIGCFSFYPTKNLGCLGDGGAIVTNDKNIAELVGSLRQYGWIEKYSVSNHGGRNSRLDEIQASILLGLIEFLDTDNEKRRNIALMYGKDIYNSKIITPSINLENSYVGHLYVITTNNRDELYSYLFNNDIVAAIHYPIPDFRQRIYQDKFKNLNLPNTDLLSKNVLTLPCFPEMLPEEVERVIKVLNSWKI